MQALHPLMLVGTGSDVDKSIRIAALCRISRQDQMSARPV